MSNPPILVCGDEMLDEYVWGEVERISPEAPVPIVKVTKKDLPRRGAMGNVVTNIEALGHEAYSVSPATRCRKLRIIARNQHVLRVDFEDTPTGAELENLGFYFERFLRDPCDIVLFSDYAKGALRDVATLIQQALEADKIILVDPKGYDYTRYNGAHLIKPNLDELRAVTGGWTSEEQLTTKVHNLREQFCISKVLLTRAGEGMTLFSDAGHYHVPSVAQEVYDVTGAGDTTIATLAVCLNEQFSWEEAVTFANKAAGITVRHLGAYAPTRKEVFGNDSA